LIISLHLLIISLMNYSNLKWVLVFSSDFGLWSEISLKWFIQRRTLYNLKPSRTESWNWPRDRMEAKQVMLLWNFCGKHLHFSPRTKSKALLNYWLYVELNCWFARQSALSFALLCSLLERTKQNTLAYGLYISYIFSPNHFFFLLYISCQLNSNITTQVFKNLQKIHQFYASFALKV